MIHFRQEGDRVPSRAANNRTWRKLRRSEGEKIKPVSSEQPAQHDGGERAENKPHKNSVNT